jgi:hypothetical protein
MRPRARKICGARTQTVTQAVRKIVVRDEIDKAFHRHGPVLADIEELFPAGRRHRKMRRRTS